MDHGLDLQAKHLVHKTPYEEEIEEEEEISELTIIIK